MSSRNSVPVWQPLVPADAPAVRALADTAHPDLPERTEVFAERIRLFPAGCRKLVHHGKLAGYAIAHPWVIDSPPPLDAILGALPAAPDCLHLHDVAVAPALRGRGAAAMYVAEMSALGTALGLATLSLVSVHGTGALWARLGFVERTNPALAAKLVGYGAAARYQISIP